MGIVSMGFGEQWAEIVFTDFEPDTVTTEDVVLLKTALLRPMVFADRLTVLQDDIEQLLSDALAHQRLARNRQPEEAAPVKVVSGADYQAAVARALQDLAADGKQLQLFDDDGDEIG